MRQAEYAADFGIVPFVSHHGKTPTLPCPSHMLYYSIEDGGVGH